MIINAIKKIILFIPRRIFIAGKNMEEALGMAARLNNEGFLTTIDILGEHSRSEEKVKKAYEEYKLLIEEIGHRGLKATISIKLTHLGLELGFGDCYNVVKKVIRCARLNNVGIEFDMEQFKYNTDTIEIFQSLSRPEDHNRICLQANIRKSANDLINLHELGFQTRLVMGAYEEESDVALYHECEIRENLDSLINMAVLLTVSNRNKGIIGIKHAIGTRDIKTINWVKELIKSDSLEKNSLEFQLLFGFTTLGRQLLSEGYPVRIYLPYGDDQAAFPYILRRLKSPQNWKLMFGWLLDKTRN